jgi:hypothetical protein
MPDVTKVISDGAEVLIADGAVDLIMSGVMHTGCFTVYFTQNISAL